MVFAAEKLVSTKLHETTANRRIWRVDTNIGMAAAGLIADARKLVEIARKEAVDYRNQYGVTIPVKELTKRVSMYMHAYTLYSAIRPFGVNCLIGEFGSENVGRALRTSVLSLIQPAQSLVINVVDTNPPPTWRRGLL